MREPCRPKAAGGLELVGLAQGNVILAGSTFRREKMRLDPCTDRRPDAARASSRRLAGRHGRHWFLRRRELIVQLAIAHRSDQNIDAGRSARAVGGTHSLEDDRALLGHRCQSISASRLTAGESGFLLLIQCRDRPE